MHTHIDGRSTNPTEADTEARRRKLAAQASLGTKRAALSAVAERELEKRYRDSDAYLPPPCPDCVRDIDTQGVGTVSAHHAKGYCRPHYWKRYKAGGSIPPSDSRDIW